MDPDRWKSIKSIFEEALELPDEGRAAFLDETCDDTETRREVESLLESHESSRGFLEGTGARELVAAIVADQPEQERIGQRFGPYRIVRRLGGGGMGAVFLATRDDGEFQRRVAVKIVRHGTLIPEAVRHFRHERQILADLDHPNIARLLDGGTTEEGVPFFLMEYVEGEPLTVYCDERQLGVDERLRLMVEVADAVEFAHGRGVIHRDLKPGNILVTEEGVPKLLDFGVAKLLQTEGPGADTTRTTLFPDAMTPRYASPEQLRGGRVTGASDVYSLGVILYELLTGRRPYSLDGLSPGAMEQRVCDVEPLAPSRRVLERASRVADGGPGDAEERARARGTIPRELHARLRGDLDRVVMKALRKRPAERYDTPSELAEDLERVLAGRPVRARANELAYRLRSWGRRLRPYTAAASVALLALLLGYWAANPGTPLPAMNDFQHLSLVTGPANQTDPRVSPDGTRVAYLSDREGLLRIWLHHLDGAPDEVVSPPLPATARDLAWAADGERLAFLWNEDAVVRVGSVTPGSDGLISLGTAGAVRDRPTLVRWIEDGVHLLRSGALWRLVPGSDLPQRVTPADFPHGMIAADVSRDGQRVVFTAVDPSSPSSADLWLSAVDGSKLRRLLAGTDHEEFPHFRGPDDGTIVYVSNASDQVDIWEVDPDSGRPVARTTSQEVEANLDVSADGRVIVFQRTETGGDLHVLDLVGDGGDEMQTADALNDYWPVVLPGGRIMFQRGKPTARLGRQQLDAEIHVTDLERLPQAGPHTAVAEGFGATPSPDGEWVALVRRPGGENPHDFQLVVLHLESGREVHVCERYYPGSYREFPFSFSHANIAWAPDGRALYFTSWAEDGRTEIERIGVEALARGSAEHDLAYAGEGRFLEDIRFSPGGRRMAWVESRDRRAPFWIVISEAGAEPVRHRAGSYLSVQLGGWLDDDTLIAMGILDDGTRRPRPLLLDARSGRLEERDVLEPVLEGGTTLDRDRRTLYFSGEADGIHNLFAYPLDGGDVQRLTTNKIPTVAIGRVAVLPDGRLLYSRESRDPNLWMLRLGR